jgi:hypothetical protein
MCEREISVADNQRCHAGRGALLASAEATLLGSEVPSSTNKKKSSEGKKPQ